MGVGELRPELGFDPIEFSSSSWKTRRFEVLGYAEVGRDGPGEKSDIVGGMYTAGGGTGGRMVACDERRRLPSRTLKGCSMEVDIVAEEAGRADQLE